ncbi:hypothetical protein HELRODRAFT_188380 [Helobdella robusta]|uniref:Transglutaminase-like domain-containing protein n=1 Tax=Helobdella robusta TaxID=6412 RepID=T1FPX8_HELRO|nr:hypothetical protein HELRODRAFT_188380 [Helobdella robusta]ESO06527.1 hypothetical protein HELRODRAFT_188380 [Helobdella robusta]
MSVPPNFFLQPANPSLRPPPVPPRYIKRQIYNDPGVFRIIDDHSVNEARTNYRNFKELMWNLVFKKHWNELEKARAIFRWMTTKNLFTIMFDSELPGSPEQVLGAFKDGKTTYAKIFECLACYAGLHCVTLSGWAKGVDYKPGMPLTTIPPNHSWNAVFIDGCWQLIDCHWATRYLQSERNTPESLVYEYDDFYFLTEPGMLVYSHMPEEPQWQLIHPVRSRLEYEEYPLVKSFFFNIGMQFLQQNRGIIFTKRGVVTVTLGFTQPTAFTFKLVSVENNSEFVQGLQLKRYVLQETTDDRVTFYFRSPREGKYYLTVFAQPIADKMKFENVFKAACEYKIICDQAAPDVKPYPLCSDANWGAGAPVKQYGLTPSVKTALISAPNGRVDLMFKKTRDIRLFARLVKEGIDEDALEEAVSVVEQENADYITVVLPASGEYGLEIYANDPIREGDTYTHICQYLVSFSDRDFAATYGQVFDRTDLSATMQAPPTLYTGPGGQFGTLPAAGAVRYGPQGGKVPPGGPVQDWDSQMYQGKSGYRPDEYQGDGSGTYRQQPGQQMYNAGGRGDQMNQAYQQQQRKPGGGDEYQGYEGGRSGYGPGGYMNQPAGKQTAPGTAQDRNTPYYGGPIGAGGTVQETSYYGTKPADTHRHRIIQTITFSGYYGQGVPQGANDQSNKNFQQGPNAAGDNQRYGSSSNIYGRQTDYGRPVVPYKTGGTTVEDVTTKKPLEIVYVTNITEKVATPASNLRKSQESLGDETNKKPVEIVYVPGATMAGPAKKSPKPPPKVPNKPGVVSDGSELGTTKFTKPSSNITSIAVSGKSDPVRAAALGGSKLPSGTLQGEDFPPPPPGSAAATYGGTPGGNSSVNYPQQYGKNTYQKVNYPFGGDIPESQQFSQFAPSEPEQEYKPHPQKTYTSHITMKAPESFKPVPIEQHVAPKPEPPAVPPKPFKDTSVFQNVDTHAVEVSKEEHKSFRDLVWHLIYAREITNELEKARAIFLWLCSKDLTKLNFDSAQKGSPEEILINLQKGQTTYAVVYEILCSYAGLHCKTISGYAKGAEYKPGMKFVNEQGQHSWNAVLVNGAWRLVDCHWAARRLVGKKVTAENVRYELDEYYFMPDPHQLIFTHFPDEVNWQLLERSISLADFENLVPVKSAFFKYGLQILGHREAVIKTKQEVTVRIGCPPFKMQSLAFTFTLTQDDGIEDYKNIKLNRFGMQEMVDNVSFFTIRPPEKGSYRLIIYAKDLDQQTKEGVYGGVCEYELKCEVAPPQPMPFPPCVHTSWGPGDSAAKYKLVPLQKGAIFCTVNGLAEVRFQTPKELRFTAKLKSNEHENNEKALAGHVMHRVVGDVAVFTINAPSRGEFGLEIYANDPEADGNSLYHAFQYLILCDENVGYVEPLPTLPSGYLGAQPMFKKLGLTTLSHIDPYIQADSGELQVHLGITQPIRVTSQLIFSSANKAEDVSDYVLQQSKPDKVILFVRLPKPGLYKLQIYALPYSDTNENLPGVFNYLISSHVAATGLPCYPKQYGQWKEGCYLLAPLDGVLARNLQRFSVEVPKANSVAVVVGDDWIQLEQKSGGLWQGEVDLGKSKGQDLKVALCANFGNVKASYSTLLEFSL